MRSCNPNERPRRVLIAAAIAFAPFLARAQGEADFYRGKTVSVGIPSDPGGEIGRAHV